MSVHYVVYKGRTVGVFGNWSKVKESVTDYEGAVFKKYDSIELARDKYNNYLKKLEKEDKTKSAINVYIATHKHTNAYVVYSGADLLYAKSGLKSEAGEGYEISFLIHALNDLKRHGEKKVSIYTMSEYLNNALKKWYSTWEENGWVTSKSKPVKHTKLLMNAHKMLSESNAELSLLTDKTFAPYRTALLLAKTAYFKQYSSIVYQDKDDIERVIQNTQDAPITPTANHIVHASKTENGIEFHYLANKESISRLIIPASATEALKIQVTTMQIWEKSLHPDTLWAADTDGIRETIIKMFEACGKNRAAMYPITVKRKWV